NVFSLPWEIDLGAGVNYVGSRTASSTAPYDPVTGLLKEAPGYWTFDAMVRRPITPALDLQLNLYNLGNTTYYDQLHPGHIAPGPWARGRAGGLSSASRLTGDRRIRAMLLPVPDVLTKAQVARARELFDAAEWVDGRATAGHQSALAKRNRQLREDDPAAREL